jgi:hypothetical protein
VPEDKRGALPEGVKWKDVSGSRLFGTFLGTVLLDRHEAFSLRIGSQASSSRITVPNFDISRSRKPDLTVAIWVKLASVQNDRGILLGNGPALDGGASGRMARAIHLHDTRFAGLQVDASVLPEWDPLQPEGSAPPVTALCAGAFYTSTLSAPPVNKWMHVVGVWQGDGSSFIYRNLERDTAATFSRSAEGQSALTIGAAFNGEDGIDGWIASVKVWGRALSFDELEDDYCSVAPRFDVDSSMC